MWVLAGEQLRRGANLVEGQDEEPPYFDSFAEYKEFCVQYRARLAQIVRSTAGWLPEQVLYKTYPPRLWIGTTQRYSAILVSHQALPAK